MIPLHSLLYDVLSIALDLAGIALLTVAGTALNLALLEGVPRLWRLWLRLTDVP